MKTNFGFKFNPVADFDIINEKQVLVYKEMEDILNDIGVEGEERELYKSIVNDLEAYMFESFKANKCVGIPYTCRIMKDLGKLNQRDHRADIKRAFLLSESDGYKSAAKYYQQPFIEEVAKRDALKPKNLKFKFMGKLNIQAKDEKTNSKKFKFVIRK